MACEIDDYININSKDIWFQVRTKT
jgi:hypothetical protein